MHIVFTTPHTRIAGGTKVILTIADRLARNGVKTSVVVKKYTSSDLSWFASKKGKPGFTVCGSNVDVDRKLSDASCIVHYGDDTSLFDVDTKHIMYFQNFGVHSPDIENNNMLNRKYNQVATTSKWLHDISVKNGHNTVIIPPGIDEIFCKSAVAKTKPPTIGCLFHHHHSKNIGMFFDIVHALKKKINIQVLFLSSSVPTFSVKDKIRGVKHNIYIAPERSLLPSIYSSCDVWVTPSTVEGFGLPTLEAMSCEVPVVSTMNRGLDEHLIHGTNCMTVPGFDKDSAKQAADHIHYLMANDRFRHKIANNGKLLSQHFSWHRSIAAWINLIARTCKK